MDNDTFFEQYKKSAEKDVGIPNFEMNRPLVTNTFKGTIGLELEIEATTALPRDGALEHIFSPVTKAMWSSIQDGSLRGEAREFIFSRPCTRDEIPNMVNSLFTVFKDRGVRLNNSNRCSTHVHINMKNRTINQITSVIALWTVFESAFIAWCGEERTTNHFALSSKDTRSVVDAWNNYLRFGSFAGMGEDRHGLKYMALNILTLFTKGSLEFRCGGAANEPTRPITWATFLDHFVEVVCSKYINPSQIAYDLSERTGTVILEEICGKEFAPFFKEVISAVPNFNESCMEGFRVVQPIVLGYPWDVWLPLINREYVLNPFAKAPKVKVRTQRTAQIDAEIAAIITQRPGEIPATWGNAIFDATRVRN